HEVEEALEIPIADIAQPLSITLLNLRHDALAADRLVGITISPADVSHVNAQYPEQPVLFQLREFSQSVEKASHVVVALRQTPGVETLGERAAEHRQYPAIATERVLQKDALKLDRVLDRVAVVLENH